MYTVEWVREQFQKKNKLKYIFFWGNKSSQNGEITNSCLSQWYKSEFEIDNIKYTTAEQYMMAEKARIFGDEESLEKILELKDPKKVKALGRGVKNFDAKVWEENCFRIVVKGNLAKFLQNDNMKQFLLQTKNKIIVEASPVDRIWGIGMSEDDKNVENPLFWRGKNLLGFALMEVRDEIIET